MVLTIKLFINYDLAESAAGPSGKTLMSHLGSDAFTVKPEEADKDDCKGRACPNFRSSQGSLTLRGSAFSAVVAAPILFSSARCL